MTRLLRLLSRTRYHPIGLRRSFLSTSRVVQEDTKDSRYGYKMNVHNINREFEEYVIVFPEKLDTDPNKNEILRIPSPAQPELDLSKITLEDSFKGINYVLNSFDLFITDIESNKNASSLDQIFSEIEQQLYPMDSAFARLSALVDMKPEIFRREEIRKVIQRYYAHRDNKALGKFRTWILNNSNQKLSEVDRIMVNLYTPNKPPHGIRARAIDEGSIAPIKDKLENDLKRFQANMIGANRQFSHLIDDPDILASISPVIDDSSNCHHRERTPIKITVSTYPRFMQICPDRFTRQYVWETYKKLCSPKGEPSYNNLQYINHIRSGRRNIATTIGYRSNFEYKIRNALARSKIEVLENLKKLNDRNQPDLFDRLQELNDFAADNFFEDPDKLGIQEYDVDFWTNKYMHEVLIGKPESEVRTFFPLESVLEGTRKFFDEYFNINISPSSSKVDLKVDFWSRRTQIFDVKYKNNMIGRLLYSPCDTQVFMTQPETKLTRLRGRSRAFDCLPLVMLRPNIGENPVTKTVHLRLPEILDIFNSFSTAVQTLLYNHDYYELNNEGSNEPESKMIFPIYCMGYFLNDYRVIQACSDRGNSRRINSELSGRIIRALQHFRPFKTWQDLYRAHLDVEVSSIQEDVRSLAKNIYSIYSPFIRYQDDYDFCKMENCFLGPDEGLSYASLWSKQLADLCLDKAPKIEANDDARSQIREFNVRFIDEMFSPNKFSTNDKLHNLLGQRFNPLL